MGAGELRDRADFRDPVPTPNGQGGSVITYPAVTVSLACATASVNGEERLTAGQAVVATEVVQVTVRRHPSVSVKQRVDVTYSNSGETVSYLVQRIGRADDLGIFLAVYCTAVQA